MRTYGALLPPGLTGSQKGALIVTLGSLQWETAHIPRPLPKAAAARLRWWGDGTASLPVPLLSGSALQDLATIVFPITCGPKYLVRYLKDATALLIVVEDAVSSTVVGQASLDVRLLDVHHPISGALPIFAASTNSTIQGPHLGSLQVSAALQYSGAVTSFELNEHITASSVQGTLLDLTFAKSVSEQQHAGVQPAEQDSRPNQQSLQEPVQEQVHDVQITAVASTSSLPAALQVQPPVAASAVGVRDGGISNLTAAEDGDDTRVGQLDLVQQLHGCLHRNFERFCTVFKAWKVNSAGSVRPTVASLLLALRDDRFFPYRTTTPQAKFLQVLLDPWGNLDLALDEVLLAVRSALEASLRVKSGQMDEAAGMLMPLARSLQQALLPLRQAFHAAQQQEQPGLMTLQELADLVQQLLHTAERQPVRYLLAYVTQSRETSNTGGGNAGLASLQDVRAFVCTLLGQHYEEDEPSSPQLRTGSPGQRTAANTQIPHIHAHTTQGVTAHPTTPSPSPAWDRASTPDKIAPQSPAAMPPRQTAALRRLKGLRSQRAVAAVQPSTTAAVQTTSLQSEAAAQNSEDSAAVPPVPTIAEQYSSLAVTGIALTTPALHRRAAHQAGNSGRADTTVRSTQVQGLDALIAQGEALRRSMVQTTDIHSDELQDSEIPHELLLLPSVAAAVHTRRGNAAHSRPVAPRSARSSSSRRLRPHDDLLVRAALGVGSESDGGSSDAEDAEIGRHVGSAAGSSSEYATAWQHLHAGGERHGWSGMGRASGADARPAPNAAAVQGGEGLGDDGALSEYSSDGGNSDSECTDQAAEQWAEQVLLERLFYEDPHPDTEAGQARLATRAAASAARKSVQQMLASADSSNQAEVAAKAATNAVLAADATDSDILRRSLDQNITLPPSPPLSSAAYVPVGDGLAAPPARQWLVVHDLTLFAALQASANLSLVLRCPLFGVQRYSIPSDSLPRPDHPLQLPVTLTAASHTVQCTAAGTTLAVEVWYATASPHDTNQAGSSRPQTLAAGLDIAGMCTVPLHGDVLGHDVPLLPRCMLMLQDPVQLDLAVGHVTLSLQADPVSPPPAATFSSNAESGGHINGGATSAPTQQVSADPDDDVAVHAAAGTPVVGGSGEVGRKRQHVFRVTLCAASGLASGQELAERSLPVPLARYARYIFPGVVDPLYTEDVPVNDAPIFAASVTHSLSLPVGQYPTAQLLAPGLDQPDLLFEVWDRWPEQDDTPCATTRLHLQSMLELVGLSDRSSPRQALDGSSPQVVPRAVLQLPLQLDPASVEAAAVTIADAAAGTSTSADAILSPPMLEVHVKYEAAGEAEVVNQPVVAQEQTSSMQQLLHVESPGPELPPPVMATLEVDIIQACGLQAAVYEAQAWLGSSASVLGKAYLVGPHPYAVLSLFPADARLRRQVPPVQTPFQAQTFCPRFGWHSTLQLHLDGPALLALSTQFLCAEVWHHCSRSMAALLQQQQQQGMLPPVGAAASPARAGSRSAPGSVATASLQERRDVLLGSASHPLSHLLSRPQGISSWLVLKSAGRSEQVGALQLSMRISRIGSLALDCCLAAPTPLEQVPGLAGMLTAVSPAAATAPSDPRGQSDTASPEHLADNAALSGSSAAVSTAAVPPAALGSGVQEATLGQWTDVQSQKQLPAMLQPADGFEGQWARCSVYLEQLQLPSQGPVAAAHELRPKSYSYYATYTLPGSNAEHTSVSARATASDGPGGSGSSSGLGASTAHGNRRTWHVPLQHCGVHWVPADERLAGALRRLPMQLQVWRAREAPLGPGAKSSELGSVGRSSETGGTGSSGKWLSIALVGHTVVELQPLLQRPSTSKAPLARWLSGTYTLIDPAAKYFSAARLRVKVLLELAPPSTPPPAALSAAATWQPAAELASGDARSHAAAQFRQSSGDKDGSLDAASDPEEDNLLLIQHAEPQQQTPLQHRTLHTVSPVRATASRTEAPDLPPGPQPSLVSITAAGNISSPSHTAPPHHVPQQRPLATSVPVSASSHPLLRGLESDTNAAATARPTAPSAWDDEDVFSIRRSPRTPISAAVGAAVPLVDSATQTPTRSAGPHPSSQGSTAHTQPSHTSAEDRTLRSQLAAQLADLEVLAYGWTSRLQLHDPLGQPLQPLQQQMPLLGLPLHVQPQTPLQAHNTRLASPGAAAIATLSETNVKAHEAVSAALAVAETAAQSAAAADSLVEAAKAAAARYRFLQQIQTCSEAGDDEGYVVRAASISSEDTDELLARHAAPVPVAERQSGSSHQVHGATPLASVPASQQVRVDQQAAIATPTPVRFAPGVMPSMVGGGHFDDDFLFGISSPSHPKQPASQSSMSGAARPSPNSTEVPPHIGSVSRPQHMQQAVLVAAAAVHMAVHPAMAAMAVQPSAVSASLLQPEQPSLLDDARQQFTAMQQEQQQQQQQPHDVSNVQSGARHLAGAAAAQARQLAQQKMSNGLHSLLGQLRQHS